MTRRKKAEDEARNKIVAVRMNELEYEMVSDRAEEAGMTRSEYLRQKAVFGKVDIHYHIVADFKKLDGLLRELSAIGNNLNQIAQYFHMGGVVSMRMTEKIHKCIWSLMEMRKDIAEMAGEYRGCNQALRDKERKLHKGPGVSDV